MIWSNDQLYIWGLSHPMVPKISLVFWTTTSFYPASWRDVLVPWGFHGDHRPKIQNRPDIWGRAWWNMTIHLNHANFPTARRVFFLDIYPLKPPQKQQIKEDSDHKNSWGHFLGSFFPKKKILGKIMDWLARSEVEEDADEDLAKVWTWWKRWKPTNQQDMK